MKRYLPVVLVFAFFVLMTGCSLTGGGGETQASPEPSASADPTTSSDPVATNDPQSQDNNSEGGGNVQGSYKINDPQALLSRAKESSTKAGGLATKWQADAKLILISSNYLASYDDKGVIDQYIYSSDGQKDLLFAVNIPREDHSKFNRMLIYKEDVPLSSKVMPLPLKYWKVSYAQAIEKADAMGGYAFRQDNPNFQMSQTLSLVSGRNMAWTMIYKSANAKDFEVVIDANSGQEIKK